MRATSAAGSSRTDWLEAIIALPLNIFYNTGIATYIWLLSNRKEARRQGYVQLIDASDWFQPLRKNLGNKNCELGADDIARISDAFLAFKETPQSKIFPNAAFGYRKLTVERPLRMPGIDPARAYTAAEIKAMRASCAPAPDAAPVIRKIHRGAVAPDPLRGLFAVELGGRQRVVEYAPDPDLRDVEQVPLLEGGGRRGLCAAGGAAVCAGRVVCSGQREGGVRDQFHALFFTGRCRCGRRRRSGPISGRWSGRPRAAGGDPGRGGLKFFFFQHLRYTALPFAADFAKRVSNG